MDSSADEMKWFCAVSAEFDQETPANEATSALLSVSQQLGMLTFAASPMGVTVVLVDPDKSMVEARGKRLAGVAKLVGARPDRIGFFITDEAERVVPMTRGARWREKSDGSPS
jgi:hypothetical protein